MGKLWIDSFAILLTHIHLCDVKGIPVARHQNLEIVNIMQDGEAIACKSLICQD